MLEIDPWSIGIHVLNVIILFVILRLLVYKPVLKFMKNRENTFANKVDELDEREKQLIRQKEEYEQMMANAHNEAAAIITKSNEMARDHAREIVDNAKEHARGLVLRAKREIDAEKVQARLDMRTEIAEMSIQIAEKVLAREISLEDNRKIIDEFFERWDDLAIEGKLKSAVKLDDLTIQSIKKRFEALVGEEISFNTEVVPDLLGGFVVVLGNKVYDRSVRAHLGKIKSFIVDSESPYKQDALEEGDFSLDINPEEFGRTTKERIKEYSGDFDVSEVGTVISSGDGIVNVQGLENCKYGELLEFENNAFGIVMNLSKESIGAVLLNNVWDVSESSTVRNTGTVVQVPVGEALLGRVVSPLGVPMDGKGKVFADKYRTIEAEAPHIFDRQGVKKPLETGIISIDSMVPIGKGQRELIIGDRQTGKTAIAVDTILNQKGKNVYCVYVAIGQKASTIASIIKTLEDEGALEYTIDVASTGSDAPSMQYIAPYAGCAIAEEFMYNGKDALIVYDDLSKHAVAYRTMSLLLRRPPGREAYPGDVFYLHSRLLERAAHLNSAHGGGSMTALPIIETMAGDISAYIPTNVISITDGQIFLESELFNAGIRPAVNVGLSVSRVGGSAQIKAMRKVAGRLRLDLAQYRELAVFAQFASDLDKNTRETLDQGARLTESLKQPQYSPYSMASQVILLYVAINKFLVKLPFNHVKEFNRRYLDYVDTNYPEVRLEIDKTGDMSEESISSLRKAAETFVPIYCQQNAIKLETEEVD